MKGVSRINYIFANGDLHFENEKVRDNPAEVIENEGKEVNKQALGVTRDQIIKHMHSFINIMLTS